jgi:hypothetical protein
MTDTRSAGRLAGVALVLLAAACSSSPGGPAAVEPGGTAGTAAGTGTTIAAGDAPAARVSGPVTGGRTGIPFNSMPEGLADRSGYTETEFFIEGDARRFDPQGPLGADGRWTVTPSSATAPYRLRIIVRRPADATRFNGTVFAEWLNVSAGTDADPDFGLAHDEILRSGAAYVGVSAQAAGAVAGTAALLPIPGFEPRPLSTADPERYGSLRHPGDDYSYDVFAQVGATIRRPSGVDPLDGLTPARVIAVGESQSAGRMVTFVDAVHPVTHVFDGFLVHSRFGSGAPLVTAPGQAAGGPGGSPGLPATAAIRADVDVPVLQFLTETDLYTLGFAAARQPDTDRVRTWEVAGTAHADRSVTEYGTASGLRSYPGTRLDVTSSCGTVNDGPQSLVLRAAFRALDRWVRDGSAPAPAPPLEVTGAAVRRDADGLAVGGIRTPAVDVPVATLTGESNPAGGIVCSIFGSTTPFAAANLRARYPTHADYVDRVRRAAQAAVDAGHVVAEDAAALVAAAERSAIPPAA